MNTTRIHFSGVFQPTTVIFNKNALCARKFMFFFFHLVSFPFSVKRAAQQEHSTQRQQRRRRRRRRRKHTATTTQEGKKRRTEITGHHVYCCLFRCVFLINSHKIYVQCVVVSVRSYFACSLSHSCCCSIFLSSTLF